MLKLYTHKVVSTGRYLEVYSYSKINVKKEEEEKKKKEKSDEVTKKEKKEEKEKDESSLKRTSRQLRRLINSNLNQYKEKDKFFTLTFEENIQDRKVAYDEFKKFVQRLKRFLVKQHGISEFKYICVPEIQNGERREDKVGRGAIHFHCLMFDMPYVPKRDLQDVWGNGIVDIRALKQFKDIAGYLCNYLTEDETLNQKGVKSYTTSQTIKRPEVNYLSDDELGDYLKDVINLEYSSEFENDFLGTVRYSKFRCRLNDVS